MQVFVALPEATLKHMVQELQRLGSIHRGRQGHAPTHCVL